MRCVDQYADEYGAKSVNRRKLKRINEHDAKLRSHWERRYRRIQYEVEELLGGWKTAQTNPIYSWEIRDLRNVNEPDAKLGSRRKSLVCMDEHDARSETRCRDFLWIKMCE